MNAHDWKTTLFDGAEACGLDLDHAWPEDGQDRLGECVATVDAVLKVYEPFATLYLTPSRRDGGHVMVMVLAAANAVSIYTVDEPAAGLLTLTLEGHGRDAHSRAVCTLLAGAGRRVLWTICEAVSDRIAIQS